VQLDAALNQHRELEGSLKNTLVSAQKVADDMRESANQEAERIVRDAEKRAELTLEESQARVKQVQGEIDGLRLKRRDVETSVEATISTLRNALEIVRTLDQRQEKVVPHHPRVDCASRAV
jgi:cell division initiation protein